MKTSIILITILMTGILAGCGEDVETLSSDSSAVNSKKSGDLIVTLQVLNMKGEPQAVFQQGENFMLDLIIENKSKNDVLLCECNLPDVIDDFFAVYRIVEDDKGNPEKTLIGKPYDGIYGFFDLPTTGVRAKEMIEYRLPWIAVEGEKYPAPENNISVGTDFFIVTNQEPLLPGNYVVAFPIEKYGIDTSFEVNFVVQ